MENKLPTQEKSSEIKQTINSQIKEKTFSALKDNLNYIYIVLMMLANVFLGILKIEDGQIGLHYPSNALGWVLWALQIFIQTFIGVAILNAFRRQGIKIGHSKINETYKEYLDALNTPNETLKPRSLKEYLTKQGTKDSITKALFYVIITIFTGSLVVSYNLNNLLSLVINIIFAIGFGIKALLDAEDYVLEELVTWYKQETKKLLEIEKEKENERTQKRDVCRVRPRKSSRIQQEKELGSRQPNNNDF